ncbi:MAG: bifunctional DNA-formamidopyrimidine glycosylase/DNA-(apurinic or apyrimidinic site) lyase [Patescibacteria group bacterium]
MPELPEVETTKRQLEKKIVGQKIEKIKILSAKQFIGNPKTIENLVIKGISRRAKIIIIQLTKGPMLLIHLKMTGQLVYADKTKNDKAVFGHPIPFAGGKTLPGKATGIIIRLSRGQIFFNDLRKFGWMKITQNSDQETKHLGPEPLSKQFTLTYLKEILSKSKRPIKAFLLDQNKIAGIGNIYASEILFLSGIDPRTPANKVKDAKKLHQSIKKILLKAIKYQGSSAADEAYIKPDGTPGKYQNHFLVYQQEGQPCKKCKTKIKRIKINQRSSYFCSRCQK